MISILIGTIACSLLGLMAQWMAFLIVFLIAKVGFSASLIFYDSMLSDITDEERMDYVSSQGYAWGYIGSCVPFVLCLVIVLGSDTYGNSYGNSLCARSGMVVAYVTAIAQKL